MSRSLCHSECRALQWDLGQTHTLGMMPLGRDPRPLLGWRVQGCPLLGWGVFPISGVGTETPHQLIGAPV